MKIAQQLSVYDNRELSWLKFNKRVLDEAADESVPLMEQLLFESIFSSNLDEFFMVRVGSLIDASLVNDGHRDNKTHLRPSEQLSRIYKRVNELVALKDSFVCATDLKLSEQGIRRLRPDQLDQKQAEFLENCYSYEISPLISAYVIDKKHPFPFLEGKSIYAVLKLRSESGVQLGIISCTDKFGRVIFLPSESGKTEYVLAEDVILYNAQRHFLGYETEEKTLIRVTRNADINMDEGFDDEMEYRESMSQLISRRKRLCPVRLQISDRISELLLSMLTERLELSAEQVFYESSPLDMSFVFPLFEKTSDRTELYFDKLSPRRPPSVDTDVPMHEQIEKGDILLSYPYESIEPFIRLLKESAEDENVVSIKMTLYRVAKNSKVVKALCDAAEKGRQVTVCVELRARFDEENNIGWSKILEESGCKVIYGPPGFKVHSKLCLITRKTGDGYCHITQVGTGNYNEKTAELYTDLSLMTANEEIAQDAEAVFRALCAGEFVEKTTALLISPRCLQNRVLEMMDGEIEKARSGGEGYIGAKINSLTDKKIIDKLIECSQAGVKIDLVIRGISCLTAGVPGYTENIRIISIVGRYLEHSRIYIFGRGESARVYISSADYMTRNTCRRVEAAAPLLDPSVKKRVLDYFDMQLSDNVKARRQGADGEYEYVRNEERRINCQTEFYKQAYALEPAEKPAENAHGAMEKKGKKEKNKKGFFARVLEFFRRKKR